MPITLFDTASQKPLVYSTGSEAKDALLSGQANFDPSQDVYLKDGSGEIVKAKGKDAFGYILPPESPYSLASDEDVFNKNREAKYGTPAQQVVTGAEGLINSAGLGFGNALTKTAIDLFTPRDSTLAKDYGKAVKERADENPMTNLTGELTGLVVDPLNAVGMVNKGAKAVGTGVAKGTAKVASKAAPIIEKAVTSPLATKVLSRAGEFGAEGAFYGGSFEAGRQMTDDLPINGDAIISQMKDGAVLGTVMGAGFGAGEAAASKALKATKAATKKYLDKITGAPSEAKGEIFYEAPITSLKKEKPEGLGRDQGAIKLKEEGEGVYKYADDRKEGLVEGLTPDAKGLDLNNPTAVDEFGQNLGIDDLGSKAKHLKDLNEPLDEFIARQRGEQYIERQLKSNRPYMSEVDQAAMDTAFNIKQKFRNLDTVTPDDVDMLKAATAKEKALYKKYAQIENNLEAEAFNLKADIYEAKKALSELDYMKKGDDVFVFNENILPKSINAKNLGKGVTPLDFEAGQMAKQFRMTPQQMVKKGNERLNEVAEFILDQYPKEGSILKKSMTSADQIFENINTTKNKAINDINDTIEQALNIGGTKQRITSQDIANHIEMEILPRFVDKTSGNPIAGLEGEYAKIKSFADGYKENGFVLDKYGKKQYVPLNVKELRDLRINLDKIAKYNKAEANALQDSARELRTWIEDEVMSRVGKLDGQLLEKYKSAKKAYGLSIDAGKIVDAAAKKAAKDSSFSLFYSGVGSAVGASVAGVPGAIVGGALGGAARNAMREFSGALSVFMSRSLGKNIESYEKLLTSTAKAFFRPVEVAAHTYIALPKDSDHTVAQSDYKRLISELADREKYAEKFVDDNPDLFEQFPETSRKILNTTLKARDFLLTKIPTNPYTGNPWKEKTWVPSPLELNRYMRYREAVNNPGTILKQIKDGYVTPEGIEVLDQVYPDTKDALMKKFIEEAEKSKDLPVQKRVELFKIFGIQLDSFMTGKNFSELQKDSNAQAQNSAMSNGNPNYKPQNAMKSNIGKKDSTLGNSTLK